MRKKILATLLVGLLTVTGTGCGTTANTAKEDTNTNEAAGQTSDQSETVSDNADVDNFTIRVGVCSGEQNQILKIVDNHTGLFKDQGIDFQTTEFAAGINTIDALTTGQLDIGNFADYAGVNRIGNTVDNTDLRVITTTAVTRSTALYVNPEKIKNAEDLYNANLVSMAGVVFEYFYGKLFEKYGIDESKIDLVNVGSSQEALALAQSGEGDAFWASLELQPKFEEYGWVKFVSIGDVDAPMYGFLISTQSYIDEHEAELEKFLKVSAEGIDYIYDHLDEVAEWVSDDTGLNKDLVISGWESDRHFYRFLQEDADDLKKVKDWCFANGRFDKDYNIEDYLNITAVKAIAPDEVTYEPSK